MTREQHERRLLGASCEKGCTEFVGRGMAPGVVSKLVGIPGCREPETLDYAHSGRIRIRNLVQIRCLHILVL
jgi:hypothetical protein